MRVGGDGVEAVAVGGSIKRSLMAYQLWQFRVVEVAILACGFDVLSFRRLPLCEGFLEERDIAIERGYREQWLQYKMQGRWELLPALVVNVVDGLSGWMCES